MVSLIYISECVDESLLFESMEVLLETLSSNVDAGYQVNIDLITQHVQDGMTMETFNLLVKNLNKELEAQFRKNGGSYGAVTNLNSATIH